MVAPQDFAFNEQTAADNEFQHRPDLQAGPLRERALEEFAASVQRLTDKGVDVLVHNGNLKSSTPMPDAVFPNNWFATEADGTIVVFPMATPNRRAETGQLPEIEALLKSKGYRSHGMVRIGDADEDSLFLEGTGSMVLDRVNRIVYAARSVRTHALQVEAYARQLGYKEVILFNTLSSTGQEFYHTNVVMSIGEKFAIICSECIDDETERYHVLASLAKYRTVMEISLEQAERFFCANLLQVAGAGGQPYTVMSESAWQGFTKEQKRQLEGFAPVITLPIQTIEYIGGGSARCMMAEVFLPKG